MIRAVIAVIASVIGSALTSAFLLLVALVHPSRRVYARATQAWGAFLLVVCGLRLRVEGVDALPAGPVCLVGNHQSALDIPIVAVAMRGDVRFMAKDSLFRLPIFGRALRVYGNIPVDRRSARSALSSAERGLTRLRRDGLSLAIFPEGTRSPDGRLLPFRTGAMKICRRTGLPVVPFAIHGAVKVNPKNRFLLKPGPCSLRFGATIPREEVARQTAAALRERVRSAVAGLMRRERDAVPGTPADARLGTRPGGPLSSTERGPRRAGPPADGPAAIPRE